MYIHLKVHPGMKRELVRSIKEGYWEISLREDARAGLANRRLIEIVADLYKVERSKVRIISGHHRQSKIFSVAITAE